MCLATKGSNRFSFPAFVAPPVWKWSVSLPTTLCILSLGASIITVSNISFFTHFFLHPNNNNKIEKFEQCRCPCFLIMCHKFAKMEKKNCLFQGRLLQTITPEELGIINTQFTFFGNFSVLLWAGENPLGYQLPIFLWVTDYRSLSVKSARNLTRLVASLNPGERDKKSKISLPN